MGFFDCVLQNAGGQGGCNETILITSSLDFLVARLLCGGTSNFFAVDLRFVFWLRLWLQDGSEPACDSFTGCSHQ